jgi:hypothetical protein
MQIKKAAEVFSAAFRLKRLTYFNNLKKQSLGHLLLQYQQAF